MPLHRPNFEAKQDLFGDFVMMVTTELLKPKMWLPQRVRGGGATFLSLGNLIDSRYAAAAYDDE